MIHAYDKIYLEKARTTLANYFDFSVNYIGLDIDTTADKFVSSTVAEKFSSGDPGIIAGKSGIEIAVEINESTGLDPEKYRQYYTIERSAEYWTGWAVAYYQWVTGLSFSEIFSVISAGKILKMYFPYHETDINHFCSKMNELYHLKYPDSPIHRIRIESGLTQKELSEISGVPLRTIQQYEQRRKNINKAQVQYILSIAHALGCRAEDLIEKVPIE